MTDIKTETEQLYDDMTKSEEAETEQAKQDQAGEQEDAQDEEEILTEEELEIEREIEAYQTKIDELSVKLTEYKLKKINDIKREEMRKLHYSDEQIERYAKFIDGETLEEIKQNVSQLDIPPANDNYADPSPMNGAKAKARTTDFAEIGRQAFGRVKNKIFPHLR